MADYIPELAKACPDDFGIVIATSGGRIYEIGDTWKEFTIQSISKPFIHALALKTLSFDFMASTIDVEPSGEAFNAISLDSDSGKPRNPMINAGAIAASAQICDADPSGAVELLLEYFEALASRRLTINEDVYRSEKETDHRHLLASPGQLRQQCPGSGGLPPVIGGVGLSLFNQYYQADATIRRSYQGSQRKSRRWRSDRELEILAPHRDEVRIIHVTECPMESSGLLDRQLCSIEDDGVEILLSHSTRLATFGPGLCFGEIGFVAQTPRTADIIATRSGECWVVHRSDFETLSASHPAVVIALLKALTRDIGAKLSQTSVQLTLMEHY